MSSQYLQSVKEAMSEVNVSTYIKMEQETTKKAPNLHLPLLLRQIQAQEMTRQDSQLL